MENVSSGEPILRENSEGKSRCRKAYDPGFF